MKQVIRIWALFILFSGVFTGSNVQGQIFSEQAFKLNRVLNLVSAFYVDSVNEDKLTEDVIRSMMHQLDPHSVYITADEVKEMNQPLQGNFEGIGVYFNMLDDTILIISPVSGGPSEKVGIRPGDRIVTIEHKNVAGVGITTGKVKDKLMGPKGTKVSVEVLRRGVKGLIPFTITRDRIPIYSLDAAYMLDEHTGYVKLNRFSATTMDEFHQALKKMPLEEMTGFVLDLRDNGGGVLTAATDLVDEFLPDNKLIVYMKGDHLSRQDFFTTNQGKLTQKQLVVLINEGTASASEIFSGAVQDWDRGLIVGRRSFGKGLVQRQFTLPDLSMIRLTVARYYTPSGRLIQKSYQQGFENYQLELRRRQTHGEYFFADSIHFPDSLIYHTLVKHRTVYGGGGIMPDIFIPADTSGITPLYEELVRSGALTSFTLGYVDRYRDRLKSSYPDFETFQTHFSMSEDDFKQLLVLAQHDGLKVPEHTTLTAEPQLALYFKALIARDLWSSNEFFRVVNRESKEIKTALRLIHDHSLYRNTLAGR